VTLKKVCGEHGGVGDSRAKVTSGGGKPPCPEAFWVLSGKKKEEKRGGDQREVEV